RAIEIGEFTGRTERRQPVNTGLDEIVAQTAKHIGTNLPAGIYRRDQIGKNAVEITHGGRTFAKYPAKPQPPGKKPRPKQAFRPATITPRPFSPDSQSHRMPTGAAIAGFGRARTYAALSICQPAGCEKQVFPWLTRLFKLS